MSEEIKDCSDEIKDRMDALAKKMQTCRQCKEDYFNLKDGLCAWCCGWRAKKAVSVRPKLNYSNDGMRIGEDGDYEQD